MLRESSEVDVKHLLAGSTLRTDESDTPTVVDEKGTSRATYDWKWSGYEGTGYYEGHVVCNILNPLPSWVSMLTGLPVYYHFELYVRISNGFQPNWPQQFQYFSIDFSKTLELAAITMSRLFVNADTRTAIWVGSVVGSVLRKAVGPSVTWRVGAVYSSTWGKQVDVEYQLHSTLTGQKSRTVPIEEDHYGLRRLFSSARRKSPERISDIVRVSSWQLLEYPESPQNGVFCAALA